MLFIQTLYGFSVFFFTAVLLLWSSISEMGHFAIANWLYFESISQVHIIWVILNVTLFLYVNYLMFFCNKGVTLQLLLSLSSSSNHQSKTSLKSFFIFPSHHLFGGQKVKVVHWIQHRLLPFARVFFVAANLVISKWPVLLYK